MVETCFKHLSTYLVVPALCLLTAAPSLRAQGGYGGPAVSSRGSRQIGARGSDPVTITPFASVNGIADSGILGAVSDENGNLREVGALYGVEANVGAYGSRTWRATRLGLDYQGNYRHYPNNQFWNGSDHLLSMSYGRQLGRRTSFELRGSGGTSSRAVGGVFAFQAPDSSFFGLPFNDIFDNRSYFAETTGSLTRLIGARNAINLGASGFAVRRQSAFLVGLNGYRTFADFSRQISRRTTIGVAYNYNHIDYPRVFGEADMHVVQFLISRQIGRFWQLQGGIGIMRSDFTGTRTITLDPLVAELLGRGTGREAFNTINFNPTYLFSSMYTRRRSEFSVTYNRTAFPGNGILLLNLQENALVNYTHHLSQKAALSGRGGWMEAKGFGGFSGSFSTYNAGTFFSYMLRGGLQFTAAVDFRRFGSNSTSFQRDGVRVQVGIAYAPGELPISFH